MINIDDQHLEEFTASAIAQDIAALNFRSWNPEDENDLDEVFTLLISDPKHNNNGTLSGTSQEQLAGVLRSGGWVFEGFKGICVKPNSPRKDEEKDKDIKYESPRGAGSLQLFIPRVSVRAGQTIATKIGSDVEQQYRDQVGGIDPKLEDKDFWSWFENTEVPLLITEGAKKKAAALISTGYPAIAINGIWGWGRNVKDVYGENDKSDNGKNLKTLHPDLEVFLNGREIVFALDRDENPMTVRMVEAAKAAFVRAIEGDAKVTDLKWRTPKGIDDYIATKGKGVKALDRIYSNRVQIEPPKPPKQERVTTGDTMLAADYPSLAKDLGIVLVQDDKGNIKSKLVELTMDLFRLVGDRLKLNQMTHEYEYEDKPLDLNHVKNFISHNLGYDSSTENCIQAVHAIANKFASHPVRKYLESFRENTLADFEVFNNIATLFLGNSDPLANKMMAKTLVGAVARVKKPGTKVDTLPVLQGGQGFLKSTFLKVLAGETWFCDDIRDLENKDELAKLARYWIVELAEVDYLMGRKEVESFKRFLSTTADTYRPPYGRANIRHERTCTLFATTNKIEFLKDPTGSRRYWVIKVGGKIDCDLVAKFRDIIWATALAAYERGDTWWLDDEEEQSREERSEEFREPDAWEEIIASKWGSLPIAEYGECDRVEINRIFDLLDLDNNQRNKPNRNRIASILKLWGFESKTINTEAGKVKAWLRPKAGIDFGKEQPTQNDEFKYKVLGKYSFLGSSSSTTSSTEGFEVELNLELNPLSNNKKNCPQNSSQQGKSLELNLEPNHHSLELNYKQEVLVVESELSSTSNALPEPFSPQTGLNPISLEPELSSTSNALPEPFSPQTGLNPISLEPELSSTSNALPEPVMPLLEPKNLRKGHFHIGQKNNSEEITRFKVGDRVKYVGGMLRYKGKFGKVSKVCGDRYRCDFVPNPNETIPAVELEVV